MGTDWADRVMQRALPLSRDGTVRCAGWPSVHSDGHLRSGTGVRVRGGLVPGARSRWS